jgi:hypothetical protein
MNKDQGELKDVTDIIRRIFKLKDNLLKLRGSFEEALGHDKRYLKDREFIKKWRSIEVK